MKRAEQLKSLKMPKKSMAEDEADLDLESLGDMDPNVVPELDEEMLPEVEEGVAEAGALEDISDDELIGEMKKRGLIDDGEDLDASGMAAEEDAEESVLPVLPKKSVKK